jgi:hypothetical protein
MEGFAAGGMMNRRDHEREALLDAFMDLSRERDDDIIMPEVSPDRLGDRHANAVKEGLVSCCPQSSLSHSTSSPA